MHKSGTIELEEERQRILEVYEELYKDDEYDDKLAWDIQLTSTMFDEKYGMENTLIMFAGYIIKRIDKQYNITTKDFIYLNRGDRFQLSMAILMSKLRDSDNISLLEWKSFLFFHRISNHI